MNLPKTIAAALVALVLTSCSTTGFMGLAKEESVTAMNEQHTREIGELKTEIERLDSLSQDLEAAMAEVARAKAEATEAVSLAKESTEKTQYLEKKMDEVRTLLKKLDARVAGMPREALDELGRVLQKYSNEKK